MDWKDILTLILAAYGALISSYLGWKKIQEYYPQIKIETRELFQIPIPPIGGAETIAVVEMIAKNYGHKTITLKRGGYFLPNKMVLSPFMPASISFPYKLEPEKTANLTIECLKISQTLQENGFSEKVKLIPFFEDEIGRMYKGKYLIFNINRWSKDFWN